MDEVNKSGPYYEAVSLCYFNGNDSGWSWTRVADIKNGELTTFLYNPDEPYFYENRNFLIDKTGKVHTKGDLAVFAWSDSPNASGSDKPFNDATELKDFPIHVFKLSAKNTLQVIDNLRNGVSCGSTSHDVMYIFCESDEGLQGVLCPAQSMEERNQQYFLKDSVSKLPYYLLKSSDILSISDLKNPFGNEKYVFLKALVPGTPISYLPTRETSAIIKDVILKNRFLTWNSFRNFTSNAEGSHKYTQKELRVFKECDSQTLANEIYSLYKKSGFIYHRANWIYPSICSSYKFGNIHIIRNGNPLKCRNMSGLEVIPLCRYMATAAFPRRSKTLNDKCATFWQCTQPHISSEKYIPAQPIKAAENWTSCFTPCKQATLLYLTAYPA